MKFDTEKSFELMPFMVDVYDKLDMTEYIQKVRKENKGITNIKAAEKALKYMLKNLPKIKEEVINIVAIIDGKDVEEIRKQSPLKTIKVFMDIFNDKEIESFFDSATGSEDSE